MKKSFLLFAAIHLLVFHATASWQAPVTNYFQKEYNGGTQSWQIKQQQNQIKKRNDNKLNDKANMA